MYDAIDDAFSPEQKLTATQSCTDSFSCLVEKNIAYVPTDKTVTNFQYEVNPCQLTTHSALPRLLILECTVICRTCGEVRAAHWTRFLFQKLVKLSDTYLRPEHVLDQSYIAITCTRSSITILLVNLILLQSV